MSNASTVTSDLHRPAYMPDLLVAALARHADRPAVYLGDEVLTASQVAAEMSRNVERGMETVRFRLSEQQSLIAAVDAQSP